MDDSGAILCQISIFTDMLDQVNEEIETNIQVTREIESEIIKCSEMESVLSLKESELTRSFLASQFEINDLISVTGDSRKFWQQLEEEICCLSKKRDKLVRRIDEKRYSPILPFQYNSDNGEGFVKMCVEFQRENTAGQNDELRGLFSEKELLENQVRMLEEKSKAVKNSILAYMEDDMGSLLPAEFMGK